VRYLTLRVITRTLKAKLEKQLIVAQEDLFCVGHSAGFFYTNKKEGSAETVFSNGLAYSNHEQFVKKNENVINLC